MPQPNDLPDWVTETPINEYSLIAFDSDGDYGQRVEISYKEYVWLKRKLARRRGYLPKPDPNVPSDAASVFERGRKLVEEANDAA